jgi:hypothetical protein
MAERKLRELGIPPDALTDPNAVEVARIWAAHQEQHISIKVEQWPDPAAWGLMLVDLAWHAANYHHQQDGYAIKDVMARIKEGFDSHWEEIAP